MSASGTTEVMTANGVPVALHALEPGAEISTLDRAGTRVFATAGVSDDARCREALSIVGQCGSALVLSTDHPVLVLRSEGRLGYVPAKDVRPGDCLCVPLRPKRRTAVPNTYDILKGIPNLLVRPDRDLLEQLYTRLRGRREKVSASLNKCPSTITRWCTGGYFARMGDLIVACSAADLDLREVRNWRVKGEGSNSTVIILPRKMAPEHIGIMGSWMGDGDLHLRKRGGARTTCRISNTAPEVRASIAGLADPLMEGVPRVDDRCVSLPAAFARLLCAIFRVDGPKAATLTLPEWFYALPEEHIEHFIGRYGDADGSLGGGDGRTGKVMRFTSASKSLARGVRAILLYGGVFANEPTGGKSRRTSYGVTVSYTTATAGDTVLRLQNRMPMAHPEKQRRLAAYKGSQREKRGRYPPMGDLLRAAMQSRPDLRQADLGAWLGIAQSSAGALVAGKTRVPPSLAAVAAAEFLGSSLHRALERIDRYRAVWDPVVEVRSVRAPGPMRHLESSRETAILNGFLVGAGTAMRQG